MTKKLKKTGGSLSGWGTVMNLILVTFNTKCRYVFLLFSLTSVGRLKFMTRSLRTRFYFSVK